jgi:tetratricopeptide (TPR) repeat protein
MAIAVHARLGGEIALAVEAFVDAARAAAARFDIAAALDHLAAALELAPDATAYALRARVELSVLDLAGAERDAAEALARGGGAAALEVAAWVAYYQRRYVDAKAFADAGARQAADPALQLSCRAVGGRVRHGAGDVAGADECLTSHGAAPEVRGVADVWLAHLRVHQGRPAEAIEIASRALIDPNGLAHPWAALHGRFARVMALGQLGRVEHALRGCDELEEQRRRAGPVGARFEGIVENMRGWLMRNIGCLDAADESNERALAAHRQDARLSAVGLTEAYWAASLDLIDGRLLANDLAGAMQRLEAAAGLDHWEGTMAWHQRQRLGLLRARAALMSGDRASAHELATAVMSDAAGRGSRRYELLAAAWAARADPHSDRAAVNRIIEGFDSCARLEGWRLAAELAVQYDVDQWRSWATRVAAGIVAASGPHQKEAGGWVDRMLTPVAPT